MSAHYKIVVDAGADLRLALRLSTQDDSGVRIPWDLTDCALKWVLRETEGTEALIDLDLVPDPDGWVRLHLTPTDTADLIVGRRYAYILYITYPSTEVRWVLYGPLYVQDGA